MSVGSISPAAVFQQWQQLRAQQATGGGDVPDSQASATTSPGPVPATNSDLSMPSYFPLINLSALQALHQPRGVAASDVGPATLPPLPHVGAYQQANNLLLVSSRNAT